MIDLDSILQQVRGIIEKASMAVQAVFFFTLAAGIASAVYVRRHLDHLDLIAVLKTRE